MRFSRLDGLSIGATTSGEFTSRMKVRSRRGSGVRNRRGSRGSRSGRSGGALTAMGGDLRIENGGRERERGIVDRCGGDLMQGVIGNVLIKYYIAGVEKMICSQRTNTVTSATRRVAHEETFHRLVAKFGLKFDWDMSKTTNTPGPQMRDIGLGGIQKLIWSDIMWQSRSCGQVEEKCGGEGCLTPVGERELSGGKHSEHPSLKGTKHPLHLPILPVLIAGNDISFDPCCFQHPDKVITC
jgi:hypothetical protein